MGRNLLEKTWFDSIIYTFLKKKCDLSNRQPIIDVSGTTPVFNFIRKTRFMHRNYWRQHLKNIAGLQNQTEGGFTARRRHLQALEQAKSYIVAGTLQLTEMGAGELLAEDLRYCQQSLNEITGEFSSNDLLGKIFSSFCIGK